MTTPTSVYFFGTCLIDLFYPEAGLASIQLIRREGVEVVFPQDQTCCGQPFVTAGLWTEARRLARRHIERFRRADAIVCLSASCVATVRRRYLELGLVDPVDDAISGNGIHFSAQTGKGRK